MDLDDRLGFLLLGCLIGFALGYIVRSLRAIKEEVHEVDEMVKKIRNEGGQFTAGTARGVALFLVVCFTVWAAFSSQGASNDVRKTQDDLTTTQQSLSRVSVCTQQYLSRTIDALNERTTYSQQQAAANVELQQAQAEFLQIVLVVPPVTDDQKRAALAKYFDALTNFVTLSGKTQTQQSQNPYPTNEELMACLDSGSLVGSEGNQDE